MANDKSKMENGKWNLPQNFCPPAYKLTGMMKILRAAASFIAGGEGKAGSSDDKGMSVGTASRALC